MRMPRRDLTRFVLLAPLCGIAGCGADVYEARIDGNAVPFFAYQRDLDSGLGSRWRKGDVGIRLPNEFKEVPAPKKKPGSAAPGRDPRLPPGFDIELPGLLGGFRGTVKAEPTGGKPGEVPVFAFVLSNRYLLASKEPTAKPQEYDKTLVNTVTAGLQNGTAPSLRQYPFTGSLGPGQLAFAPTHRIDQTSLETTIGAAAMRYEIYIRRDPPLQAAVIFVVPKEAARDENLKKRIDLSLQTLRVEAVTASAGGAGTQGGSNTPGF